MDLSDNLVCVVCQNDVTFESNEIVLCNACFKGYHQKCHKPSIGISTLSEKPWCCMNCQKPSNRPVTKQHQFNLKESVYCSSVDQDLNCNEKKQDAEEKLKSNQNCQIRTATSFQENFASWLSEIETEKTSTEEADRTKTLDVGDFRKILEKVLLFLDSSSNNQNISTSPGITTSVDKENSQTVTPDNGVKTRSEYNLNNSNNSNGTRSTEKIDKNFINQNVCPTKDNKINTYEHQQSILATPKSKIDNQVLQDGNLNIKKVLNRKELNCSYNEYEKDPGERNNCLESFSPVQHNNNDFDLESKKKNRDAKEQQTVEGFKNENDLEGDHDTNYHWSDDLEKEIEPKFNTQPFYTEPQAEQQIFGKIVNKKLSEKKFSTNTYKETQQGVCSSYNHENTIREHIQQQLRPENTELDPASIWQYNFNSTVTAKLSHQNNETKQAGKTMEDKQPPGNIDQFQIIRKQRKPFEAYQERFEKDEVINLSSPTGFSEVDQKNNRISYKKEISESQSDNTFESRSISGVSANKKTYDNHSSRDFDSYSTPVKTSNSVWENAWRMDDEIKDKGFKRGLGLDDSKWVESDSTLCRQFDRMLPTQHRLERRDNHQYQNEFISKYFHHRLAHSNMIPRNMENLNGSAQYHNSIAQYHNLTAQYRNSTTTNAASANAPDELYDRRNKLIAESLMQQYLKTHGKYYSRVFRTQYPSSGHRTNQLYSLQHPVPDTSHAIPRYCKSQFEENCISKKLERLTHELEILKEQRKSINDKHRLDPSSIVSARHVINEAVLERQDFQATPSNRISADITIRNQEGKCNMDFFRSGLKRQRPEQQEQIKKPIKIMRSLENDEHYNRNASQSIVYANPPGDKEQRCKHCTKVAEVFCFRCKNAWYCSSVCQAADWTQHSRNCQAMDHNRHDTFLSCS